MSDDTWVAARADQVSIVLHGPDQPGIVAAIAGAALTHGANIVSLDQHSDDPEGGAFFQRTVLHVPQLKARLPQLRDDLTNAASSLGLACTVRSLEVPLRAGILASRSDHCLLDLLWRHRREQLHIDVPMVISNHTDSAADVRGFGIPFFHVASSRGADKSEAEADILGLLKGNVDFVILARYMQILSGSFITDVGVPIINIHHSFLPAFIGAGPYQMAKDRGVKLIGATAHYVTEDLDEGPIIEQDVVRVTHVDSARDLQRRGADVERAVLARAVAWHSEDRIIRHENHTIVFP